MAARSPGLGGNTPWLDTTLGLATLFGRFAMIVPILALAGSMARKKVVATSAGTFPVSGPLFTTLLVGTILLVGALTFSGPFTRADHRTFPDAFRESFLIQPVKHMAAKTHSIFEPGQSLSRRSARR